MPAETIEEKRRRQRALPCEACGASAGERCREPVLKGDRYGGQFRKINLVHVARQQAAERAHAAE